jgi:hypothetical protein
MLSGFGLFAAVIAGAASAAEETPMGVLAARVREQGNTCDEPQGAKREVKESAPNETVWILKCENDTFRLTLVPDLAAKIEKLQK